MLQHYSVSWKKGLAALCLLAVAGLSGCDQQENAAAKVETTDFRTANRCVSMPITIR